MKGNAEAMNNLGYCFRFGHGVRKSERRAFRCFRAAARRGCAGAQYNLGLCYATGHGVQRDEQQALLLFERAAAGGYPAATNLLQNLRTAQTTEASDE